MNSLKERINELEAENRRLGQQIEIFCDFINREMKLAANDVRLVALIDRLEIGDAVKKLSSPENHPCAHCSYFFGHDLRCGFHQKQAENLCQTFKKFK